MADSLENLRRKSSLASLSEIVVEIDEPEKFLVDEESDMLMCARL